MLVYFSNDLYYEGFYTAIHSYHNLYICVSYESICRNSTYRKPPLLQAEKMCTGKFFTVTLISMNIGEIKCRVL